MIRYVIHADWSPEQVFSQMEFLNAHYGWGMLGFLTREGHAALLLPEGAYRDTHSSGGTFSQFRFPLKPNFFQVYTKNVEVIELAANLP